MKYAFFICIIFSLYAPTCFSNNISQFSDSLAINSIAQFLSDNAEDMPISARISDKKLFIPDTSRCTMASSLEVILQVEAAINKVLRLFPDEEQPIDEAINDLTQYLGPGPYTKCQFNYRNNQKIINSVYYFDRTDLIHVKVDTITLLQR
jgi:hypothetical protein